MLLIYKAFNHPCNPQRIRYVLDKMGFAMLREIYYIKNVYFLGFREECILGFTVCFPTSVTITIKSRQKPQAEFI
jgi:hypothetical protein